MSVYLTMLPTLAMLIVSWFLMHQFVGIMQSEVAALEITSEPLCFTLSALSVRLPAILFIGYGLIAAVGFYTCIRVNIRLIGPIIPIKRHIDKLLEGEHSERLQLRENDFLQEICDNLNQLTESLEESHTRKTDSDQEEG